MSAPRSILLCHRRSARLQAAFVTILLLAGSQGHAQSGDAPRIRQALGYVEVLTDANVWRPQTSEEGGPGKEVTLGLRTGTGRALIGAGERGQVLVGSASRLRRYQNEVDLLEGRFLLTGPVGVHVQGRHVVLGGAGRTRVDLQGVSACVAVLSGSVRVALPSGTVTLNAGQQLNLKTGALSAFREADPWYAAQFTGAGVASIEAMRGPVSLTQGANTRPASAGDALERGQRLNTGAAAWAEVGFTGGGYLRLNEQSELTVLSVERTSSGREVLLSLTKGTAWNVVEKGQGGYRIDTPVVSTAVRGTTFRVDSGGTVKVLEGAVALPGSKPQNTAQGDAPLEAGQQRNAGGQLGPLQLDALDRLNLALDAERARPLTLVPDGWARAQGRPALAITSLPDARVNAVLTPLGGGAARTLPLTARMGEGRYYPDPALLAALPEGAYRVTVGVQRFGVARETTRLLTVDRTAPHLSGLRVSRQGRLLLIEGEVTDALSRRLTLSLSGTPSTLSVPPGAFRWLLPATLAPTRLTVTDEAGNETHVALP